MSGLEDLKIRLDYRGGISAEKRLQKDKERTLKKALLYSYQSETIILSDGRKFRCLINTEKTKADYDTKVISIPYKDICLGKVIYKIDEATGETIKIDIPKESDGKTSDNEEVIGMKCGDIFEWERTGTFWIAYLEKLEEKAYFRAEIYRCDEEVEINDKKYHVYIRGPVETTIQWNQKSQLAWNDMNYSLIMYITKNEETLDYFHRFQEVKVSGKTWQVKTVDPYSADGIIEICLGEYYENNAKQYQRNIKGHEQNSNSEKKIVGSSIVNIFDICEYYVVDDPGVVGTWRIDNQKKAIIKRREKDKNKVIIEIVSSKGGCFNLIYESSTSKITFPIIIKSI